VEDRLNIELSGARPGLLGSAVIAGLATDVIDTGYWLTQAWQDWFHGAGQTAGHAKPRRVLVVEDSDFFRQLVTPILGAEGYQVTAAPSAADALRLREGGAEFDAIVSDIAMPDMDGLDFARAVRASGPWSKLPMIALSARTDPADIEAGRDAGFTDYVAKFQREALIASLRQCLAEPIAA
jgi:two-component system, chemotaxis family, sensor kinase CheA